MYVAGRNYNQVKFFNPGWTSKGFEKQVTCNIIIHKNKTKKLKETLQGCQQEPVASGFLPSVRPLCIGYFCPKMQEIALFCKFHVHFNL